MTTDAAPKPEPKPAESKERPTRPRGPLGTEQNVPAQRETRSAA